MSHQSPTGSLSVRPLYFEKNLLFPSQSPKYYVKIKVKCWVQYDLCKGHINWQIVVCSVCFFVRKLFSVAAGQFLLLMISRRLTKQDSHSKLLEEDICAKANLQHTALCWNNSCTAFTTETMKNAVKCGWMAMIITAINKHCLLHE